MDALGQLPSTATQREHEVPVVTLALAYTEAGDPVSAGRVAAEYLSRHIAWPDLLASPAQNYWALSHLFLGELDEQNGDKAGACGHFAKILERWGHAKPRSVTADEARVRAKTLVCDAGGDRR